MAALHKDAQEVGRADDKIYYFNYTTSTFTKRQMPIAERGISYLTGKALETPWYKERIQNEVAILQLLSSRTKIPVPVLRSWGEDSEGLPFLETVLVEGIQLERVGEECRMPHLHSLDNNNNSGEKNLDTNDNGEKNPDTNVDRLLLESIRRLPELRSLRSATTGLDGFVIPPTWILGSVDRPRWEPKTSDKEEYVMVHGDLGPHNVMMDLKTLEVRSIIDWEYGGYFPPEFQRWSATRIGHFAHFGDEDLARELAASIEP